MADMDGIRRRIRLTLEHGKAIAFVGWRDSYHDDFTRGIPKEKVVFTDSTAPPAYVEFIFFTPNVPKTLRGKISDKRSVWNTSFPNPGEIKELLREFAGMIVPTAARATSAPPVTTDDEEVLDWLTQSQELGPMEKFVQEFLAEAAKNNSLVSSRMLKVLKDEHAKDVSMHKLKTGWIIPEKAQGKNKVGWYRAGVKMEELAKKVTVLPDAPLARAEFIIKQKDSLLADKATVEAKLAEINAKLALIEKVETKIDDLNKLLK